MHTAGDMSMFVRKYSNYLNYTCTAYRTLAMDICRIPKGYVIDTFYRECPPPTMVWSSSMLSKPGVGGRKREQSLTACFMVYDKQTWKGMEGGKGQIHTVCVSLIPSCVCRENSPFRTMDPAKVSPENNSLHAHQHDMSV